LLRGAAPGTDIVLSEERIVSSRAFANKIWNAARFIVMQMEKVGVDGLELSDMETHIGPPEGIEGEAVLEDRWIFHRLNETADKINAAQAAYRYHEVADAAWAFLWDEFCDWYVEVKKLRIQQGEHQHVHLRNLLRVFEFSLRLLHPVMPFLTEELWQRLLRRHERLPESICIAPFPQPHPERADAEGVARFVLLQEMAQAARALRADQKVDPKQQIEGILYPTSKAAAEVAKRELATLEALTNTKFEVGSPSNERAAGSSRATNDFEVVLKLSGAQADAMRTRLRKEIEQLGKVIDSSKKQLGSEVFVSKAPAHVIDGIRAKLGEYEAQLAKSVEALRALGG